ncbi:MAG: glycosyltransferase family 39 protein [Lentisphaerae bacterium]|nr:glycosyltransferase family 39 protein [Lentisphaerota bacterium]
MNNREQVPRYRLPLSQILLALAFLIILFYRGFSDPDEGRYSEIPREMIARGDWKTMRLMDYLYYEKPPVAYWITAAALSLFGIHDWAARVPLLLVVLSMAGLMGWLIRSEWKQARPGLILFTACSTAGFAAGCSILLTDSFLMLWMTATSAALYRAFKSDGEQAGRMGFLALAAVAAVLGVLTKGAVAVVLPGATLVLWLLWEKRLRALFSPAVIPAVLLFTVLLIPSFLFIEQWNPGFLRQFVFQEHLARFLGTRAIQLHDEPFWFYGKVLPLLLLPWTFFLFRAGRQLKARHAPSTDTLTRYLLVWAGVVLLFFSIGTGKLMSYILPAIPPLTLLIGRWGLIEPQDGTVADRRLWNTGVFGLGLLLAAFPVFWCISYFQLLPGVIYKTPLSSLTIVIPIALAVWLGRPMTGASPAALTLPAASVLLSVALLMSPIAGRDMNVLLHSNSSIVYKSLAAALKPDDTVIAFWDYRPALPFYARRVTVLYQIKNELEFGMQREPGRPGELTTPDELRELIRKAKGRVYGVIRPGDFDTKFKPLGIGHEPGGLPGDPDTVVVRLLN